MKRGLSSHRVDWVRQNSGAAHGVADRIGGPQEGLVSSSAFRWAERRDIQFILGGLPDRDPYHAWNLFELPPPRNGEVDMMVLTPYGLTLIEVKSHPAEFWIDESGALRGYWLDDRHEVDPVHPFETLERKAQTMRKQILRFTGHEIDAQVHTLVFLGHELATCTSHPRIALRSNVLELLEGPPRPGSRELTKEQWDGIQRAVKRMKLNARPMRISELDLTELVERTDDRADWRALNRFDRASQRRVRVYLECMQTDEQKLHDVRRRAIEEKRRLDRLVDLHTNVLSFDRYVESDFGATFVFHDFPQAVPLDQFLRQAGKLPADHALGLVRQLSGAVAGLHGRGYTHPGLTPDVVLVRRGERRGGPPALRVFPLASGPGEGSANRHRSYRAPELRERRTAVETEKSNVYAVGALAYLIACGTDPPAEGRDLEADLTDLGISGAIATFVKWTTGPAPSRPDELETLAGLFADPVRAFCLSHSPGGCRGTVLRARRRRHPASIVGPAVRGMRLQSKGSSR